MVLASKNLPSVCVELLLVHWSRRFPSQEADRSIVTTEPSGEPISRRSHGGPSLRSPCGRHIHLVEARRPTDPRSVPFSAPPQGISLLGTEQLEECRRASEALAR